LPGVGLSDVAAAELLERLVDGAIFGGFIAAPALLGGVPGWPLALGLGALVVYLPLLAAIPCMSWYLGAAHEATGHGSHRAADQIRSAVRLSGSTRLIRLVSDAVRRRGPALVARAATLSLVAWATEALSYYCLLVAFGWLAPPTLPFAAVGVANFAFAVPGPPAGVGAFHLPISSLLVDGFGAEPSLAAAFAVALHVGVLAPVPLLWALLAARARLQPTPVRVR
jgi:uncharacterized membrane protein YbhN (UPF0104 family)